VSAPRFSEIEAQARAAALAAKGPAEAAKAAIKAAETFLRAATIPLKLEPLLAGLACGKGCAHCCHQMVGITLPEAALLAQAVDALPRCKREKAIARIKETATKARGMGPREWWAARLPCPLLTDGLCSVHAARPLPCRAMNSADSEFCRQSFEGEPGVPRIPILAAQHGIYGHAQAGLAQATGSKVMPLAGALAGLL
jgi:Fe-S-cluster containining protein